MSEFRCFVRRAVFCGECARTLRLQRRPETKDGWMLVHDPFDGCSRSGKKFYTAPLAIDLTEIPDA